VKLNQRNKILLEEVPVAEGKSDEWIDRAIILQVLVYILE
jgi:hypothetical protein